MKIKTVFSLLLVISAMAVVAQPNKKMVDEVLKSKKMDADTAKKGDWKKGGSIALNFNQQNNSNWIGATEKFSLSLGASLDIYANMAKKKSHWDNALKLNYGVQNTKSQGTRKTSDFIDFYSKYGINLNDSGTLAFANVFNFRSQFTNGYDYSLDPKRRTSGFFAPANILLTPGIDWRPAKSFSLFFSPAAAKWIIVSNRPHSYNYPKGIRPDSSIEQPISRMYGVDPIRKVDFQFGAFVSANFKKELLKNVLYTSRLDLYSNYLDRPGNIDIFWTNNLIFKVNKWFGITYQWNLAYDDNYVPSGQSGPRTQFLGTLGIGLSGKF